MTTTMTVTAVCQLSAPYESPPPSTPAHCLSCVDILERHVCGGNLLKMDVATDCRTISDVAP